MKVSAVTVDSYEFGKVEKGLAESLDLLGGWNRYIQAGDRVLIKPNMLEGVPPAKAVTTHPEVVRAVLRAVKQMGAYPIVGDSPGTTGTLKAAERCGIFSVCREEGVELVAFDTTCEVSCPNGSTLKKFKLARPLTTVDKVISVAKMKTHTFMGVTGATKNLFGLIVGMEKAQFHLRMQARREFAGMLLDLAGLVRPVLSIVDGVVGMEGNGPRNGQPIHAGLILAGGHCLAVDVVMAEMMGFAPDQLPLIALALEQGLTPPLAGIELVGNGRERRFTFAAPKSLLTLEDRVPKWVAKLGRRQLTARPVIADSCIGCGRCAEHCPPRAMTVVGGKVCIDYDKCIRCYCCQEHCPADAVTVREGVVLNMARRFL